MISGYLHDAQVRRGQRRNESALQVVRDWQLGWLLRYQNGALIETPSSSNQLINELLRQGGFNGTPVNPDNRVAGVNPLLCNPNCGCFNPQTDPS